MGYLRGMVGGISRGVSDAFSPRSRSMGLRLVDIVQGLSCVLVICVQCDSRRYLNVACKRKLLKASR